MKLAVIGSRGLKPSLNEYIPRSCDEIVSGGAKGVDALAAELASNRGIRLTEFLPDYKTYGRAAPIVRNRQIVNYADAVYAFWDGRSRGTKYVIDLCAKLGKACNVFIITEED